MLRLLLVILFLSAVNPIVGDGPDSISAEPSSPPAVVLNLPDTLKLNTHVQLDGSEQPESNWPWISAALVGVLSAVVNILLGAQQRRANEKALREQLSASKEGTLTQFKATLASSNRQQWIDKLRDLTSQLLSEASMFQLEVSKSHPKMKSLEARLERFVYLKSIISMLLNEAKPEQKALMDAIRHLDSILESDDISARTADLRTAQLEVIQAGRALFGLHWKKIKALT